MLPSLSFASWLVESQKWRLLVKRLGNLRFRESVFQNLTAQAASFVTPLKAGEFATKACYFPKIYRKQVLQMVLIGNLSQMFITVVVGACGIAMLYHRYIIAVGILLLGVLFMLGTIKLKLKLLNSHKTLVLEVVLMSLLRYVIFSSCWWLLLLFYSDVSFLVVVSSVAAMYVMTSLIPSLQILDLFVKWTVASFFVSHLALPIEIIIGLTALLWLNNQVLPVIAGCALLGYRKSPRTVSI